MKRAKILPILTFLLVFITSCQDGEKSNLTLLSNQIPTDTPLIFGQGVISIDLHAKGSITFNPEET